MRILVVGGGGREHALAWRLEQAGHDVVCAPGNGGTPGNRPVAADDVAGLVRLAEETRVGLVVVGPEVPLVAGLVDALDAAGIAAFGPRQACARLEGSKVFSKDAMLRSCMSTIEASEVIGTPIVDETPARINGLVQGALEVLVNSDVIVGYSGLNVRQLSLDPTVLEVKFMYRPAYPLNYVLIVFGIDTTTGALVTTQGDQI